MSTKKIIYCGKCGDEIKFLNDLNVTGMGSFHNDCCKKETNWWSKLFPTNGQQNGTYGTVQILLLIILCALYLVLTSIEYWYIFTVIIVLVIAVRIHSWITYERHLEPAPKEISDNNKTSKLVRLVFVDLIKGILLYFIGAILLELLVKLILKILFP